MPSEAACERSAAGRADRVDEGGADHPQPASADRSLRGRRRSRGLAAADLGGDEDQSAPRRNHRGAGSGARGPARLGPGATFLMAPFTHVSPDRPSRFSAGLYGVLYVGDRFDVALMETIHHHARFMAATAQEPGWTSQFRELILDVAGDLADLRGRGADDPVLDPDDYGAAQALGAVLRAAGADGVVYPSVRSPGGFCAGLFRPDRASGPIQGVISTTTGTAAAWTSCGIATAAPSTGWCDLTRPRSRRRASPRRGADRRRGRASGR